eukprot:754816-Hanusia_phi.AAC.1
MWVRENWAPNAPRVRSPSPYQVIARGNLGTVTALGQFQVWNSIRSHSKEVPWLPHELKNIARSPGARKCKRRSL